MLLSEITRPVLTADEVAELLGCSSRHVQRLVERGQLRGVKLGKLLRIPVESLAELIDGDPGDEVSA